MPLQHVLLVRISYGELLRLMCDAVAPVRTQAFFNKVSPEPGLLSCRKLMFGMTSIFVNLSETMAETGFMVGICLICSNDRDHQG